MMTGRQILQYLVGVQLGKGGMGEVYQATDTRLGREVALKFLPASFQYDPARRGRFMREARAASSLNSPNIAAIYDIAESDDELFIVMELVRGDLLSSRIARGPLSVRDALDIASQIADALDEAGVRGIVHRDIKSANVMITERGLVKVLDFGLAQTADAGLDDDSSGHTLALPTLETTPGTVLGTVAYMSPEQALGHDVDNRTDLFSLGVVLYEMLTGRLPFEGVSSIEVIDRIVHTDVPPAARLNYGVTPEIDQILRKALAKDRNFRYQSARELYIDLYEQRRMLVDAASGSASLATTDRWPSSSWPRSGSTGSTGPTGPTVRLTNAVAVLSFANITKEATDAWIGAGIAETVTADLKNAHGLSVMGRERVFDTLKSLGVSESGEADEHFAIEVGRRLGATWIVSGGYQRVGESIRITARLVEVGSGELVRGVKIDGKVAEIFDLQDKIVYELTQGLNVTLADSEINEIERDETASVEAYECYSRGMMNLRNATRESLDRAVFLFGKATEYDPEYASAWAALGVAYDVKASYLSLPDLATTAVEYLEKAIALNPKLSRAYDWLSGALMTLGRHDEAVDAAKRSLALDPSSLSARQSLARAYWIGLGKIDEGIAELEAVVAADPRLGYAALQLALLYTIRGDFQKAETMCRKTIELQEQHISGKVGLLIVGARTRLGYVYYLQERYDEALREYELELDFLRSTEHALRERAIIELYQKLGAATLRLGRTDESEIYFDQALAAFDERVAAGADDPATKYYVACLWALRGDADRAVKALGESMKQLRALDTVRARRDPDFDAIRDDARFRELVPADDAASA